MISNRRAHVCGDNQKYCKNCSVLVDFSHQCFILTESEKNALMKNEKTSQKKLNGYIFFYFKSYVDNLTNNHVVNLAMAQKVCLSCLELDFENRCVTCKKQYEFKTIEEFCKWCLKQKFYIQIAHNLKGYDGVFLLNYFINYMLPSDKTPDIILNGTKILSIQFRDIKIIDSYSFLAMALAEFPKTFWN